MKKLFYSILLFVSITSVYAQKGLYKAAFGVQAYTFRNQFPKGVEATLDTIKMLGFTEIEAGIPKGYTAQSYKKACNDRGIDIVGTGVGFEQLTKDLSQTIADAKAMGARYVMCAWIPHKGNDFTIDDAKKAVEAFNIAGKTFAENGLTFCYHDHGYEFRPYGKGTLMDYIIQNTDARYVSYEMDVLWTLHGGGDPVKLLKKYKNRWKLMHVKDLKKGIVGDGSGHTPAENDVIVGTGQADWKGIFKQANKIGMKHFFIEDESNNEIKHIPQSIAYIKSL